MPYFTERIPVPEDKKNHRLRRSQALMTLLHAAENKLTSDDFSAGRGLFKAIRESSVPHKKEYEYTFEDFSKLRFDPRCNEWFVYYPSWIKRIFVPSIVPISKDKCVGATAETEVAFDKECTMAETKPLAYVNIYLEDAKEKADGVEAMRKILNPGKDPVEAES